MVRHRRGIGIDLRVDEGEREREREKLVNYADREANLPSSIALLIRHSIRQTPVSSVAML